jgi:hypothetical protein
MMLTLKMLIKSYKKKTKQFFSIFVFARFSSFFASNFLEAFFKAGIDEFEISIKISYTHFEYFAQKMWVILALFVNFKCKFAKHSLFGKI